MTDERLASKIARRSGRIDRMDFALRRNFPRAFRHCGGMMSGTNPEPSAASKYRFEKIENIKTCNLEIVSAHIQHDDKPYLRRRNKPDPT